MPTATETRHFSHSQHTSMLRCAKAYELERLRGAPRIPAWWFLGGSCVHQVTETYDRLRCSGTVVNVRAEEIQRYTVEVLDALVADEKRDKQLTNFHGWFAAGRATVDKETGELKGGKQGYDWWAENAPVMVQNYLDWYDKTGWQLAYFGGTPAIEFEVSPDYQFGRFKGFIDRVFVLPSGDLVVADIKTSTSPPKEPLQLGDYANALEMMGYPRPKWGTYIMVKHGEHTPIVPLDKYTTHYLEGVHGPVRKMIDSEIFPPNVGDACRTCVVQKSCFAYGGVNSVFYDRLNPNYQGA